MAYINPFAEGVQQMSTQYHGTSGSFGDWMTGLMSKFKTRGNTFAYVNPWHAAMDDFLSHTELKQRKRARKRPRRKVNRPEERRPSLRL